MIVVRKLFGLSLIVMSLAACQKTEATKTSQQTRPAVRAANGTLYDLKCLKAGKPGSMSTCVVNTAKTSARKAYNDLNQSSSTVADVSYFVWQISYFDESSLCQWMWGMPSCYDYFGTQPVPGPRCEVNWLFQYQDLPQAQARNCGQYWNPWYTPPTQGGGWNQPDPPTPPTLSCADIKIERDWQASQAQYCDQDSQCEVAFTQSKWGGCAVPSTNKLLHTPELDYWTDQYKFQCFAGISAVICPLSACTAPKCVSGRCNQTCP